MIDHEHELPISRQAQVLGISRGSVYYLPRAVAASDLVLMRRIDELHLDYPFAGSRILQGLLKGEEIYDAERALDDFRYLMISISSSAQICLLRDATYG
jgi:putative transposase